MANKFLGLVLLDKNKYKSMVFDQIQQGGFLPQHIFPHDRICAQVHRLMKSSPFSTITNQHCYLRSKKLPYTLSLLRPTQDTKGHIGRPPNHRPALICSECPFSPAIQRTEWLCETASWHHTTQQTVGPVNRTAGHFWPPFFSDL